MTTNGQGWDEADLYPCGESKIEHRPDTSDEMRSRFRLDEGAIQFADASTEKHIRVLAKHDGNEVGAVRPIHKTGDRFTLNQGHREQLGVSPGDSVQYWVGPYDQSESSGQETLSDINSDEIEYIRFENNTATYHQRQSEAEKTFCGQDLSNRTEGEDYRVSTEEPGNLLDPCRNCQQQAESSDMNHSELRGWLSDEIDGVSQGSQPGIFRKAETLAIVNHIKELRGES